MLLPGPSILNKPCKELLKPRHNPAPCSGPIEKFSKTRQIRLDILEEVPIFLQMGMRVVENAFQNIVVMTQSHQRIGKPQPPLFLVDF